MENRLRFQWDKSKAAANLRKHGIPFDEAPSVFLDPFSLVVSDDEHSSAEERFVIIGRSIKHRLLVVVFTDRDREIRLISARRAAKGEQKTYEQNISAQ
ncbi:MAG: membrane protein [Chloroflexota bacterium]|nr:MAG: membrane protein [Chloroflexota bacterium]